MKKDIETIRKERIMEFLIELRSSGKLHGIEYGYVDTLIRKLTEKW